MKMMIENILNYVIKNKFYRDQTMRQEAWEEIAREINSANKYLYNIFIKEWLNIS